MFLFNFMNNKPLQYSIILYTLILVFFNLMKPEMIYNNNKKKDFGIGKDKTLFPIMIQSLLLSIFVYLILNLYF